MRTQSPAGTSNGHVSGAVDRRPWMRPARVRASVTVSPTCQSPSSPRIATSAPAGARSSANPPPPAATTGPTAWAVRAFQRRSPAGVLVGAAGRGPRAIRSGSHDTTASTIGCQPVHRHRCAARARWTAAGDVRAAGGEGGDAHHDPGGAEPALGRAGGGELRRPRIGAGEAVERRDVAPGDAGDRRHTGDARLTVDPDRAATALPLGAATVLRRARTEAVAEDLEERGTVVRDLDGSAVEAERDQLKLWPHPQVRVAFGFVILKPASVSPLL